MDRALFGFAALTVCFAALIDQRGVAQEPNSSLAGRVVDAKSGVPVANATVFAAAQGQTQSRYTSLAGEFTFTFPKPVKVRLWVEKKPDYLRSYAGQLASTDTNVEGSTIDLPTGAHIDNLRIRLWPAASLSGRVTRGNDAIAGATVLVLRREYRGGSEFWWRKVPLASTHSDNRGMYRIGGLAQGTYLVAVLGEGRSVLHSVSFPTFSPYSHLATAATAFTLAPGSEDTTGDVQVETNEAVGSITGRVVAGEQTFPGVTVRLRRVTVGADRATDLDEITALTDNVGTFRFSGLPLGAYKLRAVQFPKSEQPVLNLNGGGFHGYAFGEGMDRPGVRLGGPLPALPTAPTLYAERDVLVDPKSSDPLVLELQPTASISGRIVFQDSLPPDPDDLLRIPMLIRPADGSDLGGIPQGRIERDGSFRSIGLPPGDYIIAPLVSYGRLSQTWGTVALTSGGMDLLGGGLKLNTTDVTDVLVILSTKAAEVSGSVRWPNGSPPGPARVIIFPKSELLRTFYYAFPGPRRVTQANVSGSGAFRIVLPPGEYFVAAICDDLPDLWMTPDYLTRLLPWASSVRLASGDKALVSVEARTVKFER